MKRVSQCETSPTGAQRAKAGPSPIRAVLALALFPAIAALAQAPVPVAAPAASFSAFQVIGNYNIFNADRVGYTPGAAQVRVDTITLVGTLQSERGRVALFDSSDRAYRKGFHEGEKVAEFTVTRIADASVELTRDAKPVSLTLGQQLRRPPGGAWTVGAASRRAETTAAPAANLAPAPALPSDLTDPVRQLMEQRKKLLNQ
jgi:hypothetical protein